MLLHHLSIRTADIFKAIAFYELLGFEVKERFTTGYTLSCWLEGLETRLELMQIPEPKPPVDSFHDEHYVGYYHLSFDISNEDINLSQWLEKLAYKLERANQQNSVQLSPLKVLLSPQQQMIEDKIYEIAFIADSDHLPLEIIRRMN